MPLRARGLLVALPLWLSLALASPASADAVVIVDLKHADGSGAEGTVQLAKGEVKHRCTTKSGRCEIRGVSGGMYTVTVEQPGRPSPKEKTAVIPPSGEVKLIVNVP